MRARAKQHATDTLSSAADVSAHRTAHDQMPVTNDELSWLEKEAESTLGLRESESRTLRFVLQLSAPFSYRQVGDELGMSAEGVKLALAKFQRRRLIELRSVRIPRGGARSFIATAGTTLRGLFDRMLAAARAV